MASLAEAQAKPGAFKGTPKESLEAAMRDPSVDYQARLAAAGALLRERKDETDPYEQMTRGQIEARLAELLGKAAAPMRWDDDFAAAVVVAADRGRGGNSSATPEAQKPVSEPIADPSPDQFHNPDRAGLLALLDQARAMQSDVNPIVRQKTAALIAEIEQELVKRE